MTFTLYFTKKDVNNNPTKTAPKREFNQSSTLKVLLIQRIELFPVHLQLNDNFMLVFIHIENHILIILMFEDGDKMLIRIL